MNAHAQRGRHLFELKKFDLAEKEFHAALAIEPTDAGTHALLAACMINQKRPAEAYDVAREAVTLDPENAYGLYILSFAQNGLGKISAALESIDAALRLRPEAVEYHYHRAAVLFDAERYVQALEGATTGLKLDPQNVSCANLRVVSLIRLDRADEADAEMERILALDPEFAWSHENKGWSAIRHGRVQESLHHFRESLRIYPHNARARQGLLRALKSRNFVYRWLFNFYNDRSLRRGLAGIYIGLLVATALFAGEWRLTADIHGEILGGLILTGMACLFFTFMYVRYSEPFFNLLLYCDPLGRRVLSDGERHQALAIGLCLSCVLIFLPLGFALHHNLTARVGITFLMLLFPTAAAFRLPMGNRRRVMAVFTVGLAICGFAAIIANLCGNGGLDEIFLTWFIWGWFMSFIIPWMTGIIRNGEQA